MPSTEARIHTHRASRYLNQLCSHAAQISALPHGPRHGDGAAMAFRAWHPVASRAVRTPSGLGLSVPEQAATKIRNRFEIDPVSKQRQKVM